MRAGEWGCATQASVLVVNGHLLQWLRDLSSLRVSMYIAVTSSFIRTPAMVGQGPS